MLATAMMRKNAPAPPPLLSPNRPTWSKLPPIAATMVVLAANSSGNGSRKSILELHHCHGVMPARRSIA